MKKPHRFRGAACVPPLFASDPGSAVSKGSHETGEWKDAPGMSQIKDKLNTQPRTEIRKFVSFPMAILTDYQ